MGYYGNQDVGKHISGFPFDAYPANQGKNVLEFQNVHSFVGGIVQVGAHDVQIVPGFHGGAAGVVAEIGIGSIEAKQGVERRPAMVA